MAAKIEVKENYGNNDARCPFYKKSDPQRIVCEGFVDNSNLIQFFRKGSDKIICKETFCDHKYENCEIYQALKKVYDEE